MKFEIADWRFEVTWDGLHCQPIERGRAKAVKKPAARPESRQGAGKSDRHATGLAVQTINKQTRRNSNTGSGSDLVMTKGVTK
jgi:hypothetical protein